MNNIFSTRDITLAATLVSLKFYLLGIDYQIEGVKNQAVGYFKFKDTPEIQEAKMKFMQSLLSVEPKLFATNLRSLKSEIIGASKNPHTNMQ